jgi:hypothetical protein
MTFWLKFALGLLCAATTTLTAQNIPPGSTLPVVLNSSLDARKDKPGSKIEGRLKQDVSLPSGAKIRSGSRVTGHIVSVTKPSRIVLRFDQLEDGGKTIPLNVSARAIAAMESVYSAQVPIDAESNYESENQWTMRQVGGDIVNRGRGLVASGDAIVGQWKGGVWAKLAYVSDCPPRNMPDKEQPMWVFSVDACGLYGFRDLKLVHAGDTDPSGQIVLESGKDVDVGGGSGWLLVVNGSPSATH